MSIDDIVKLLDSTAKLVGALAWPVLVGFVLIRFGPSLREFFASLGELSFKGPGFEATAKRQKAEAAAALAAAVAARPSPDIGQGNAAETARAAEEVVSGSVTPRLLRRAKGAFVLWVDDRPNNNVYERQSLEALGVKFVIATSTEEGLEMLRRFPVDAIISDMGRPPDDRAGYTLLDKLRASGNHTPFIIYAGSNAAEHKAEARQHGAMGSTNRASELFEYVLQALGEGH